MPIPVVYGKSFHWFWDEELDGELGKAVWGLSAQHCFCTPATTAGDAADVLPLRGPGRGATLLLGLPGFQWHTLPTGVWVKKSRSESSFPETSNI